MCDTSGVSSTTTAETSIDTREQLFNQGCVGPITEVQVPTEMITQLNGIMFDLDTCLLRASEILPAVPPDPGEFYRVVVDPWLSRHPTLNKAEVRNSGQGLHVLLWFKDPVTFESDEDRKRWIGIIKTVQVMLPIDPDQPHITALTRPAGSINGKNDAPVERLKKGEPVGVDDVLAMHQGMMDSPFKTVMQTLTGTDQLTPCPCCGKEGSHLKALDFVGSCYGNCGNIALWQLFDLVLANRSVDGQEAPTDDAGTE